MISQSVRVASLQLALPYLQRSRMDHGFWTEDGLVAVDRRTQRRTIKPSAAYFGNIARGNSL